MTVRCQETGIEVRDQRSEVRRTETEERKKLEYWSDGVVE